jgi:shikimate 5-dehydrogenase
MRGADGGETVAAMALLSQAPKHAAAYDLVYNPPVTPFLQAAEAQGLACRGGLGMLVGQAAAALELWLGLRAPRDAMQRAAEEALFGEGAR